MNKQTLIALGIVALLIVVFVGGRMSSLVIHGYDGPVATIVDIDAPDYGEGANENYRELVTDTHAHVYLDGLDPIGIFAPCGLRMEIQAAPNVISSEIIDTLTRNVIDTVAKTNTTTTVEVQRVRCDMQVHVTTYEGGLASCYGATVWIQVEENAYSIFSNADNNIAWIAHIYTRDAATEIGSMEFIPTSAGYTFPLTTVSKHTVPQWLRDSGYSASGELFEVVKFPIEILSGVPYLGWITRHESSISFDIGFDVILVGEWKEVHPYLEGGWPDPTELDPTWLIITILLSIVGVAGSVLIVVRLGGRFHPVLLFIFVALTWVPLILWLGTDLIGKLQEFLGG